jgi:STE24 endopeptidase
LEVVVNEPKSTRYHRLNRLAGACSLVCTAGVLGILLWSGGSATLRDVASSLSGSRPVTVAIYVVALAVIQEAFSLPLVFYRSFVLDRRYELGLQPLHAWVRDHAKAFALVTALLLLAVEVVYALIAWSPRWWWLPAGLIAAAAAVVLVRLAPVLLLPIFYKLTPLARDGLAERLVSLSRSAGVRVLGVYEWGLGAKTRRANAALVGSGATRRILLSDTLLAEYSDDEIEVILAHELAHHVHRDIPLALVLETVILLASGCAAASALNAAWRPLGLTGPADVAGLPLLLLAAGAVMLAASPAANALSRLNERRADRFALKLTNRHEAFVSAMRRLAAQNLLEEHPSRAVVWLFHTHPPIAERIEAARSSAW